MRVISGKFKGRILKMPRGTKIRPTSQKVKEALFSILGTKIHGASFLELFAGSGSIGIEAKSRGAKSVFLVENNRSCVKTIQKNLEQLEISYDNGLKSQKTRKRVDLTLLPVDVEKALKMFCQNGEKFDFVFLDPPYFQDKLKNSLIKICHYDILNPRSYVVAEHHKSENFPHLLLTLRLMFSRRYGDAALTFYQKEGMR